MAIDSDPPAVSLADDTPELAQSYARRNGPQFGHGRLLLDALALQDGESLLDLGSGTGELARLAADRVGATGTVLALEPLPERVALARSIPRPNLRFDVGSSDDLETLPSAAFDVVLLNSVFHWIADQQCLLHDLARLLKPGGRLGLSTGIADRPHQQAVILAPLLAGARGDAAGWLSPPHAVRREVLSRQLEESGWSRISIDEQTFVDHFPDLEAIIEWNRSSFFGNFLQGISPVRNPDLWAAIEHSFERFRQPEGIRLERHLLLVKATRP